VAAEKTFAGMSLESEINADPRREKNACTPYGERRALNPEPTMPIAASPLPRSVSLEHPAPVFFGKLTNEPINDPTEHGSSGPCVNPLWFPPKRLPGNGPSRLSPGGLRTHRDWILAR
jgi:hypothetical protein